MEFLDEFIIEEMYHNTIKAISDTPIADPVLNYEKLRAFSLRLRQKCHSNHFYSHKSRRATGQENKNYKHPSWKQGELCCL